MEYIGIDLHRRDFRAVVMDEKGKVIHSQKYENDPLAVKELIGLCQSLPSVVIEATRNWMWLVQAFQKKGCQVSLAHPLKTKAIASARIKTDTLDATTLAHLLRSNLVPSSYIPSLEEQDDRELSRARCSLVQQQTLIKNKIHALLAKENLSFSGSDLFGQKGRAWLKKVFLRETRRKIINHYLDLLRVIEQKIQKVDELIQQRARNNRSVEILLSIPGIGLTTAFLLSAEIGDIKRFSSGQKLASYLGLVPRVHQSGGKRYLGRITKLGNPYVRWALVQTAHRLVRTDQQLKLFYASLARRGGKKKAIVAVARKLAVLAWRLLTDNRLYQKHPPRKDQRRYST